MCKYSSAVMCVCGNSCVVMCVCSNVVMFVYGNSCVVMCVKCECCEQRVLMCVNVLQEL